MMFQNKVSVLCRYGGNFVEESGKVSYKGGTNRLILLAAQEINYPCLLSKLLEVCKWTRIGSIEYKHPELGLGCLVSVENDEDLCNMMQAFETHENGMIHLFISEAQQTLPIHNTIPSIDKQIAALTEENHGGRKAMLLQNNSSMDINAETAGYHKAWRGRELAQKRKNYIGKSRQDYTRSYYNIEKLCEDIRRTNPGSRINLQSKSTDNNHLEHNHLELFISYGAAVIPVFQLACKPLVRLISVKVEGKCPYIWFMAVGFDTDMRCLLLACGFIELDHKKDLRDGYKWFCGELFNILGGRISNLVFVVDYRHEGGALDVVRAIFPHSHCTYNHLSFLRKIRNKFGNLSFYLLRKALNSTKQSEFDKWMSEMYEQCPEAWEFLRNINPEYWAISHFKGSYDDILFSESDTDTEKTIAYWIGHHKRDLSVVVLVEHLHNLMMKTFTERVARSSGWTTILIPRFETHSPNPFSKVQILESTATTPTRFAVFTSSFDCEDVDIHMRNCSCGAWQIFGHPCDHAEEVINKLRLNRYEYWDECYKAGQYRKAYSLAVIHPLRRCLKKKRWVTEMLEIFLTNNNNNCVTGMK